jgi:hypothetical protein
MTAFYVTMFVLPVAIIVAAIVFAHVLRTRRR